MAKKDAKNDNEEESEYSGDDFDISKSSLKPNNQKKAIHVKEEVKKYTGFQETWCRNEACRYEQDSTKG